MKIKILVGALVFLVVMNLAAAGWVLVLWLTHRDHGEGSFNSDRRSPASVFERRGGREGRPGGSRGTARFHLNPEERAQLLKLLHGFRDETENLRARIDSLEMRAVELMKDDPVPRAELDSILVEISAAQLEISRKAAEKMVESKSYLSPQQQEFFFEAIHRERPGRGRGWERFIHGEPPRERRNIDNDG